MCVPRENPPIWNIISAFKTAMDKFRFFIHDLRGLRLQSWKRNVLKNKIKLMKIKLILRTKRYFFPKHQDLHKILWTLYFVVPLRPRSRVVRDSLSLHRQPDARDVVLQKRLRPDPVADNCKTSISPSRRKRRTRRRPARAPRWPQHDRVWSVTSARRYAARDPFETVPYRRSRTSSYRPGRRQHA